MISVFAQQLQNVTECRNKAKCCIGEDEVLVNPNFFIGVTYNPGYAGRTFIPHTITEYFRSISMTVPDVSATAEFMLYSQGFMKGR